MNLVVFYGTTEQPRSQLRARPPFKLTYGVDFIILVEVEELRPRVIFRSMSSQAFREEADLTNKAKEMSHIWEKALK